MSLNDSLREIADRQAADWLIRLRETDDEAVFESFEAWVCATPENAAAWSEIAQTSHAIAAAAAVPSARRPGHGRIRQAAPGRRGRRLAAAFAACAAALFAVVAAPDAVLRLRSDYATGAQELRTVRLEDGSTVTLAPRSAVSVRYQAEQRHIDLLKGDAYFEVARNPDRPFSVTSRRIETTVLGTGFEVRSAEALVGVRHGRVKVETTVPKGRSRILTAGEIARADKTGALQLLGTDPDNVAAWTQKRLIVEAQPVSTVVDALRPWYGGVILTKGARLETARVTGVYDLGDPVGALIGVSRANGATVQRISPWVMIISFD